MKLELSGQSEATELANATSAACLALTFMSENPDILDRFHLYCEESRQHMQEHHNLDLPENQRVDLSHALLLAVGTLDGIYESTAISIAKWGTGDDADKLRKVMGDHDKHVDDVLDKLRKNLSGETRSEV